MKRTRIRLLACLLCFALCGCGAAEEEKKENKEFTASGGPNVEESDLHTMTLSMRVPETLNPLLNREETVDRVLKLLYMPVFEYNQDGKPAPAVGKSWKVTPDGRAITVELSEKAKWQDGTPVSPEDVVYSFHTIQGAPEDSVYKKILDFVSGCKKTGDHAVTFTFRDNFSGNVLALRFPVICAAHHEGNENADMSPKSSGAYVMEKYTQGSELILKANKEFAEGKPKIPKISVKVTAGEETDVNAFEQGMTDILVDDAMEAGRYGEEGLEGMHRFPSCEYDFIGFNFRKELLQDKKLRQAIAYVLPKESLAGSAYLQYADMANTPISPKSWLYEENTYTYDYDPDAALELLHESGWKDEDKNGILEKKSGNGASRELSLSILVNKENTARRQVASKLKEEMEAVGFRVTLVQLPYEDYQKSFAAGDYDLVAGGWKFSEVTNLSPFFRTNGAYNFIHYSDPETDKLLDAAYHAVGEDKTKQAYSELQKRLAEELPYISVAFREKAVFTSQFVGGDIHPTGFNSFRNVSEWTYEKKAGK